MAAIGAREEKAFAAMAAPTMCSPPTFWIAQSCAWRTLRIQYARHWMKRTGRSLSRGGCSCRREARSSR